MNESWIAFGFFFLSTIIVSGTLYKFYGFMIWDSTYDALGFLWLPIPVLAIFSSTIMLSIYLPKDTKLIALFYIFLIPIMIIISFHAQQLDYRQLTASRGARISRALDAYHAQNNHFPQNLQALIPRHFLTIPSPVIIYGQNWCYDGGADYYRLGFLSRDHWSSPNLFGKLLRTWGDPPDLPAICEREAAEFLESRTNPIWTFQE